MKDRQDLERMLRQAAPTVLDGPHRQWLKESLSRQARSAERGPGRAIWWGGLRASRRVRVAAAILGAAILVATGWGAEQVYQRVARRYFAMITTWAPEGPAMGITTPEGKQDFVVSGTVVRISTTSEDPNVAQAARREYQRQQQEVKSLIAAGKYELVKSFESTWGAGTQYVYKFKLSDGRECTQDFGYPLEKVTSWEDYEQKVFQEQERRNQAIGQAISKGDFRLLDIDLIREHVCRDPSTGAKLSVMEVKLPDGSTRAVVQPYPLGSGSAGYDTPWEEHLREIKEGHRELLDVKVTKRYAYEMTLEDGSKTIFSYGGGDPLVKGSKVVQFSAGAFSTKGE